MARIDPQQERARLAAHYAAMSDFELQEVGQNPSELTEWARGALTEEMKRRRLEWRPAAPGIGRPAKDRDILMHLGTYENRNTAGAVREFLAGKGITAFFYEEEPSPPWESKTKDEEVHTQLLVRAGDLALSRSLIAENEKAQLALESTKGEDSPGNRPVAVRVYRDTPQAFVEKSLLEDAGILCFLEDDNVIRMDWLWANGMGGIKLMVRQKDAVEADRILGLARWDAAQGQQHHP